MTPYFTMTQTISRPVDEVFREEGVLVSAATRDITERVEAHAELRLHGEIMHNMAEGVAVGIRSRCVIPPCPRTARSVKFSVSRRRTVRKVVFRDRACDRARRKLWPCTCGIPVA
jgi:hypothetical protein